jgi:hypothetical protein
MMEASNEELTPNKLKKKAYLMVTRLAYSGHDGEVIYARLEKEGIPDEIIKEVMKDITIEHQHNEISQAEAKYEFAWMRVVIGVVAAIVFYFVFGEDARIPAGVIATGLIAAFLSKKKM